ncbi:hypothetical protein [Aliiglaciecola sp. LCG003]|uniref:hypothetical protein n=1 Tax=Aliiglaciecola sp. LCG003 TaxID=3053655 RepID=UPI0025728F52|nr:hypothetical protein [Aliiglaciecola sp. LCG003]WJG09802.1 hypothetical protein QR722_01825 [Aliiglaciecola sp. LCG003]
MATKKSQPQTNDTAQASDQQGASSELDTLRQIVFGAAKADLEHRLTLIEQHMQANFQQVEQAMLENVKELQTSLSESFDRLTTHISSVDKHFEDKTAELQSSTEKLSSELEMSDTNGRQETDELHTRLDKEVAMLTAKYDARFTEALARLDQVTKELSSTKTDRKTLAKLLATMAINLETDEE